VPPPAFDTAGYLAALSGDVAARQAAAQQARQERRSLPPWWLRRMVAATNPARERLTFVWHDHFATSADKVQIAELMYRQHQLLYRMAGGRFDELVHAVALDGAMLIWLDGRQSTGQAPNENFARELFELFTLGHAGHDGDQPYTEVDVHEAARALTGWTIDRATGTGRLIPARHDGGVKQVLGVSGRLGLDEVVAAATAHPACAPHVAARLWRRYVGPVAPDDPDVREVAAPFARDLDIGALVRRIALHPAFTSTAARTGMIRMPVDLVVGTHRALGVPLSAPAFEAVLRLGQVPFFPPDVAGWPAGEAWLSTASAQAQLAWALAVAAQVDPGRLEDGRPSHLAYLLGVDEWSDATVSALEHAPGPVEALALAIVSPEHVAS
jgi:uncharacterized protein (DUF1800 family)